MEIDGSFACSYAGPDTVSALDAVIRMHKLGLCLIAGNLESFKVKVVDLAFQDHGITRLLQ
jgi:hypothetical protein